MAALCNAGREGIPMLTEVPDGCPDHDGGTDGSPSLIDGIVREGARRMLAEALQAEGMPTSRRIRPR